MKKCYTLENGLSCILQAIGSILNWGKSIRIQTLTETDSTWSQICSSLLQSCFPGSTVVKNMSASAGDREHVGLVPGLERAPGVGNGQLLQYSCLENPMDRGATAMGLQSRTWLSNWACPRTLHSYLGWVGTGWQTFFLFPTDRKTTGACTSNVVIQTAAQGPADDLAF